MPPDNSHDWLDRCTAEFWASTAPSRSFDTLRECLIFLANNANDEPLPNVHVHATSGDYTINGPKLEALIAAAKADGTDR
jgi:hypothetical protein